MPNDQLLPCPFCKAVPEFGSRTSGEGVPCSNDKCRAEGPATGDYHEGVRLWNTRTTPPSDEQEVERLCKKLTRTFERDVDADELRFAGDLKTAYRNPDGPEAADLIRRLSAMQDSAETYEIGKRDGYESAVQDIDLITGGDGEYRYCTNHDPERHCPDAAAMKARIADRFAMQDSGAIGELREALRPFQTIAKHCAGEPDDTVLYTHQGWMGDYPLTIGDFRRIDALLYIQEGGR